MCKGLTNSQNTPVNGLGGLHICIYYQNINTLKFDIYYDFTFQL